MSVAYKPFESKSGFTSPGFTVSETGVLVASTINTTELKLNSLSVLTSTTLGSSVVNSRLTSVGTLTGLTVNSTLPISLTTTGALTLTTGVTSNLNNMNIGNVSPGTGDFTAVTSQTTIVAETITANANLYIGNLNVKSYAAALAVALS